MIKHFLKSVQPERYKSKVISIVSRVELCSQVFNEVSSFHQVVLKNAPWFVQKNCDV